jgi:hypothetical protein
VLVRPSPRRWCGRRWDRRCDVGVAITAMTWDRRRDGGVDVAVAAMTVGPQP